MREGVLHGLRYIYNLIDTTKLELGQKDLPELVTAADRMGYNGLAITHPYKQTVIPLLDELSPDAEALGAASTPWCSKAARKLVTTRTGMAFTAIRRRPTGCGETPRR